MRAALLKRIHQTWRPHLRDSQIAIWSRRCLRDAPYAKVAGQTVRVITRGTLACGYASVVQVLMQ